MEQCTTMERSSFPFEHLKLNKTSVIMFPAKIHVIKKIKTLGRTNKLLFKPIILCLILHGISVNCRRDNREILVKCLVFIYHFFWITGTISTTSCLWKLTSSFYVFSAMVKIVSILLWWILYKARRDIYCLLRNLTRLHNEIDKLFPSSNIKSTKTKLPFNSTVKLALFVLVVFTLIPGFNNVYNTLKKDTVLATCFHLYIPLDSKTAKTIMYFAIQTNHHVINWTVSYLATLLIIFCYLELGSISQVMVKEISKKRNINPHLSKMVIDRQHNVLMDGNIGLIPMEQDADKTFFMLFEELQDMFVQFEDCFSLTCFFVLIRLFMEFFRIFSLFFNLVKGKPQSVSIINASSYASVTGVLFIAMIFAADRVQKNFTTIRRYVLKRTQGSSSQRIPIQGSENVTLTGWGIFELKKKLLLSTLASLITYGVLLQQLQQ